MDVPVTSIRGKDWIYNALWSSCSADTPGPRCLINIPLTFLFRDGQPGKSLVTDIVSGLVKRVQMDDIPLDRVTGEIGFRGENLKRIRILRQLLLDYQGVNKYDKVQAKKDEPHICTVSHPKCNSG